MNKYSLDQCEQEKLHLSGAIQSHGTLLVVNSQNIITHVAKNITDFLPSSSNCQLNQVLPDPFLALTQPLEKKVGSKTIHSAVIEGKDGIALDLVISCNTLLQITLELIPHKPGPYLLSPLIPNTHKFLNSDNSVQEPQNLVQKIYELIKFDRVLYYQFQDQGDGVVTAETESRTLPGSYLGLRFPASDVPKIARALYLTNPWRMISDALANNVEILSHDSTPPDLSFVDLRSVSPIHAAYLTNMGARSSLSFPIIVGDELWGLVACHNCQRYTPSLALLDKISLLVREHTKQLIEHQSKYRIQLIDGLMRRFMKIQQILSYQNDILTAWPQIGGWLAQEFAIDGAVIGHRDQFVHWGLSFEPDTLEIVDLWFVENNENIIWCGDFLRNQIPEFPLSQIAGMLAIKIKLRNGDWFRIYLCRQEYIHEVAWGGNPNKPVEYESDIGISPRRSFEKWVEKRFGQSRPWNTESRLLGLKLRELLIQNLQ